MPGSLLPSVTNQVHRELQELILRAGGEEENVDKLFVGEYYVPVLLALSG